MLLHGLDSAVGGTERAAGKCRVPPRRETVQADVDRREVSDGAAEKRQRAAQDVGGFLGVCQPGVELGQELEAAAGYHLRGGLRRDVHDPFDETVAPMHRRVGEREVALLEEAPPVERDVLVLDPGRPLPTRHALHHGTDLVPHLRKHLTRGRAQSLGVLVGDQRDIRLVVDHDELRPPQERHGKAGVRHQVDGVEQRLAPGRDVAEWGACPVDLTVGLGQGPERVEECAHAEM